jgi:hypothetical protein
VATPTRTRNRRLTLDEALRPIEATCGKCGRTDATIYPWEQRGILVCPSCSPLFLIRFMRDWAEKQGLVAA